MTAERDNSEPLAILTKSIEEIKPYDEVAPDANDFVTIITKCGRHGWDSSPFSRHKRARPVFVRAYKERAEAEAGHKLIVELLAKGRLQLVGSLEGCSEEELRRFLYLRAIEWTILPSFLSTLYAPILFMFFKWPYVIAGLLAAQVFWSLLRDRWISPALSTIAAYAIGALKWPIGVGSAVYLYWHHQYLSGSLALSWPLLAGFVPSIVPAIVPSRQARLWLLGMVGTPELALKKRIGYVDRDATP